MPDKEIDALAKVAAALDGLDEAAIARVMLWIGSKYNLTVPNSRAGAASGQDKNAVDSTFEVFPDFYDAANPKTENTKVLVAAFWLQTKESKDEWDSQSVNSMLKNLGHPISNITRTLDRLQAAKPRLAMQTQKSGKAQQARKLYKLTVEGTKLVKRMLSGENVEVDE